MSGIHRFLTRRDKHNKHGKQNKEESSNILSRPPFRSLFSSEHAPDDDKEEEKKIKLLERRISQLGITGLKEEHIKYALRSIHAQGDVDQAFDLLLLLEDSIEGIIRGYTSSTKLLGAENRQGVTCYLDALLFAMFARLDCFEAILYKSFNDEPRRKLANLLRLWVNMLRAGKLITTDITKHLQDALAECGWEEAAELRQQDTSEAFTFITEKLELPLLTLKMDIYHTGKEDVSDDHKFVNERLLEVAIPPEPADGRPLTLEDCLEAYFNNRIEVKRYLERRNTAGSVKSFDSMSKGVTAHVETVEVGSSAASSPIRSTPPRLDELTPLSSLTEISESTGSTSGRNRRSSILQERFIPDSGDTSNSNTDDGLRTSYPQTLRGTYRKEVMMPAWQFFSLIPWYTDNTPTNDAQVAAHFSSKRPILGLCLKRYSMLPNGNAIRLNTYIDIPTEIGLPHFIQDDNMDADGPIYGNFKLSLQAFVCHRGNSVDSGHYIAIVRGTSAGAAAAGSNTSDKAASDASKYWMRFDDLAAERVTLVDVEQALRTESPYLLFYQILPINEDAAEANFQHDKPPSYTSSESAQEFDAAGIRQSFLALTATVSDQERAESVSTRPSFEITGPDNLDSQSAGFPGRRQSVGFSDTIEAANNPSNLRVASTSPTLTPRDDEGRGSFSWSRRGSRATKSASGSRAGSQTGENRISATFSRFAGRLSRDRMTSDGNSTEGEGEEAIAEYDPDLQATSTPTGAESKERNGRGRTSDRDKGKGKTKDKSREKSGRGLERECVLM